MIRELFKSFAEYIKATEGSMKVLVSGGGLIGASLFIWGALAPQFPALAWPPWASQVFRGGGILLIIGAQFLAFHSLRMRKVAADADHETKIAELRVRIAKLEGGISYDHDLLELKIGTEQRDGSTTVPFTTTVRFRVLRKLGRDVKVVADVPLEGGSAFVVQGARRMGAELSVPEYERGRFRFEEALEAESWLSVILRAAERIKLRAIEVSPAE